MWHYLPKCHLWVWYQLQCRWFLCKDMLNVVKCFFSWYWKRCEWIPFTVIYCNHFVSRYIVMYRLVTACPIVWNSILQFLVMFSVLKYSYMSWRLAVCYLLSLKRKVKLNPSGVRVNINSTVTHLLHVRGWGWSVVCICHKDPSRAPFE